MHFQKKIGAGLFGGEGMTKGMREEMYKLWGEDFIATQNYGMSELNGPGLSGESPELVGMHISEDHFIPEIINPELQKGSIKAYAWIRLERCEVQECGLLSKFCLKSRINLRLLVVC